MGDWVAAFAWVVGIFGLPAIMIFWFVVDRRGHGKRPRESADADTKGGARWLGSLTS